MMIAKVPARGTKSTRLPYKYGSTMGKKQKPPPSTETFRAVPIPALIRLDFSSVRDSDIVTDIKERLTRSARLISILYRWSEIDACSLLSLTLVVPE